MLELMVLLDPKMTREEFKKLIAEYDKDGDGEISWEEFCVLMKPAIIGQDLEEHDARMTEEDMRAAFGIADADDSGYIEKEELGALLASLGEGLNNEDLDALFEEMDEDGSGGIDFEEFKALMMVLNDDHEDEEDSTSWEYEECSKSSYTFITDSEVEEVIEDHPDYTAK